MSSISGHTRDSFLKHTARFRNTVTCLEVLIILLTRIPATASEESEETDCREVSGYTSGPAPDTCTVPLTLNDTEADIIRSLIAEYQDFPLGCRLRKYMSLL